MHYPKLNIISPLYATCTLSFKYTFSLSSIVCAASEASVLLKDLIISDDEDDKTKNGNNEEEEVDDTLITLSKKSDDESYDASFSRAEDEKHTQNEEAYIETQESSSELNDPSSDSYSESDDAKGLNLRQEKLVLEMWKTQKEYVKEEIYEAVNDFVTKVLWHIRRDVILADYMKILDFPTMEGSNLETLIIFRH